MKDPHGFPWDLPKPDRLTRILFGCVVGIAAASIHYFRPGRNGSLSDFSILWYGSQALLHGASPYDLIGPGRAIDLPSNLYYPAPALVAVMPLAFLPVNVAGAAFVFLSASLLGYGITADGWYRVPMLASVAFLTAARLGQWSIIMTAAVFIPILAIFSVAKPQASIPYVAGATSRLTIIFALAGVIVFGGLSFVFLPQWPASWLEQLGTTEYFKPPVLSTVGVFVLLVLLRWRRPEAWLVFSSACLPQTWYPYNALILMVVAFNYREMCLLSLLSSISALGVYLSASSDTRSPEMQSLFRGILIGFSYLPATILILRRPNAGTGPVWLPRSKH